MIISWGAGSWSGLVVMGAAGTCGHRRSPVSGGWLRAMRRPCCAIRSFFFSFVYSFCE